MFEKKMNSLLLGYYTHSEKINLSEAPLNDKEQLRFSGLLIVPFAHCQG
jgi:hypothetical protein